MRTSTALIIGLALRGTIALGSPSEDMLALVEASPAAVAAHDSAAWLELFADDALIEDPVGSPALLRAPEAGEKDPFKRFYDVFIAPHAIAFRPFRDYIKGDEVLRDLTIETRMDASCRLDVPVFISYRLKEGPSGLRIAALRAYWELSENAKAILGQAWGCSAGSLALSSRMLKELGAPYALAYAGALNSVGGLGKWQLHELERAIDAKDERKFMALFAQDAAIDCGDAPVALTPGDAWPLVRDGRLRFRRGDKIVSAGRSTLARVELEREGVAAPATLQLRFGALDLKIRALTCYAEARAPR